MKIHRPLPPHLTIYKSQLTSTFPISHRISGAILASMVLLSSFICLKIGLISLTYYNFYQFFFYAFKFIPSSVDLTAFALFFHLYHGVRHLLHEVKN
uniref:succinate dehydrogenase subunit 3 n=1 Tax=Hedyosmum orientale TaxID=226581 RepID=UPI00286BF8FC|nr:succinate dehydrogenase subunit 3 [Hedyosmum orientale]WKT05443.1 succinate dehydrogenase subunit 3 [Hedyosmum orientale]